MGGVFHAKCTDAESREMLILAKIQPRTKNKQRKCAACSLSQCVCNRNIIFQNILGNLRVVFHDEISLMYFMIFLTCNYKRTVKARNVILLDNNWLKYFAKGSIKDIDVKERIDVEIADNEPGA